MKPIHLLAGLFGVLMIFLDAAVLTGFNSDYHTPLMLYAGLAFGQLALLAFWCAMAHSTWIIRLTITLSVAGCLSQPLGKFTGGSHSLWFTLFCLFAACIAGTTLLARSLDLLPKIRELSSRTASPTSKRRLTQFSLGGLLSAMTVVGLALGISRHFALPRGHALVFVGYGLWLVLIALATLWALGSRRVFGARLMVLAALCLVAGWFMARAEYQQSAWFFTNIAFVESIIICSGFAVIQIGSSAATRRREA